MSIDSASRPNSVDNEQDNRSIKDHKEKSRKPADTPFRQQRLKAWLPVLTPKTVIPLFFIIGIIFTPLGGGMLYASKEVDSLSIDYSTCTADAPRSPKWGVIPQDKVDYKFRSSSKIKDATWQHYPVYVLYDDKPELTKVCRIQFDIPNDIGPPVLLYYTLTEFNQNHRRYVKSFDADQLKGQASTASQLRGECNPLRVDDETGKPYYPCGLIANSLFNDTFSSPTKVLAGNVLDKSQYVMSKKGITFKDDAGLYGETRYTPDQVVPPPNWRKRFPNGYTNKTGIPNIHVDEAFQVWMRTAGLPTFSKMARRNDSHPMKAGRYQMEMRDNFPVTAYSGTKSIFFTTRTVMGGKNSFLGAVYMAVGGLCLLLGLLFTAINYIKPRKQGDHRLLSWNKVGGENSPDSAAFHGGGDVGGGTDAHESGDGVMRATGRDAM